MVYGSTSTVAPASDLAFLKCVVLYEDRTVRDAPIKSLSRHLCYPSEMLVPLAFFDLTLVWRTKVR